MMRRAVRNENVNVTACDNLARTVQSACFVVAIAFFAFGVALALFIPASFEIRASYFLFFGCIPTLVFYLSGHFLRYSLGRGYRLCENIARNIAQTISRLAVGLLKRMRTPFVAAINRFSFTFARCGFAVRLLLHTTCSSISQRVRQAFLAFQTFCCLLIRSTALIIISFQVRGSAR